MMIVFLTQVGGGRVKDQGVNSLTLYRRQKSKQKE
jgi:hypothetical protein